MPRTTIPSQLIHRPEEVSRNAERFDQLCELAEEVCLPVVRDALINETKATGAEAVTDETKHALQTLLNDINLFANSQEEKAAWVKLRESLTETALPSVDEEECRSHTRDVAQVLTGTWVELLRERLLKIKVISLSEHLLPTTYRAPTVDYRSNIDVTETLHPLHVMVDALAPLALDRSHIEETMSKIRGRLFLEPCSVDLPFDMLMFGAPENPIFAMKRPLYDRILAEQHIDPAQNPMENESWKSSRKTLFGIGTVTKVLGQHKLRNLTKPISRLNMTRLAEVVSKFTSVSDFEMGDEQRPTNVTYKR